MHFADGQFEKCVEIKTTGMQPNTEGLLKQ
jgi:hypothetical protein